MKEAQSSENVNQTGMLRILGWTWHVNQSINQISIAPISPAYPGSVARQSKKSLFNSDKAVHQQAMGPTGHGRVLVPMEERSSQRDVLWDIFWRLQLRRLNKQIAGVSKGMGHKSESHHVCVGLGPRDQSSPQLARLHVLILWHVSWFLKVRYQ